MKARKAVVPVLVLAVLTLAASAQGSSQRRGGPPDALAGQGLRPLPGPLFMAALDADADGILSGVEIVSAPAALLTLDKNQDGQLTLDEFYGAPGGRGAPPPLAGNDPGGRGPGGPGAQPVFAALDANHDGVIDAQEIASAPVALLTLDKNKDGQLTPDELYGPRGGMPAQALIAVLDANHDGVIDAQEIVSAPTALLTLDKNKDGQLTPDELFGPRGGRGGQQPPAGNAPGGPPPQAIVTALDANHDGVIDAQEIAAASAALLTLDKNKDGQLTPDELR